MKQKIFAIGLAAMLLAASSLGAAAIGVQPRMSLASAAQAKQVVRAKKLTDSQYEALRGELMQLFNFPELISGNVNRKEMTLELEVVGQASTGLQSRIKELEKEYGVDSKISIVEGYESAELPLAEDPVENNNAFAEQVKEQLGKESYTSITVAGSRIIIGMPSVESIEKIEVLRQTFEEQEELSPVDYLLCRYSCQQLEEAKAAVDKELADIAKQDGGAYSVRVNGGYLELYCPYGRSESLESWLANSSYPTDVGGAGGQEAAAGGRRIIIYRKESRKGGGNALFFPGQV